MVFYLNTKNILLTGGRAPVCLHLARLFTSAGHRVYVADSMKQHVCRHSKFVKKSFITEKPTLNPGAFIHDLITIIKNEKIDLLIPTCEEIFYISSFVTILKEYCDVFVESIEILEILHNKYQFIEKVKEFSLPYPHTIFVDSKEKLEEIIQCTDKDMVIKPVYSRFSSNVFFIKNDKKWIPEIRISTENPWVIQQMIKGTQFCTYSIIQKGNIVAHSSYATEFSAGGGATIAFKHTHHEEIDKWIGSFVKKINFTGQIAFDFIVTNDGQAYPIECNPRATSGIHLFTKNEHLEKAFLGETKDLILPNKKTQYMISLAMLIYGWQGKNFKHWMHTFFHAKDVLFHKQDWVPFFYQFITYGYFIAHSKKHGISVMQSSTYDIEWNGKKL